MTMLVDDKSWVARQLSLGKHIAWIEQQRQIPRAEILSLGESIGMHFDEAADVMTSRPKGLDVDPNAPAVHPEGYTNPSTVPARLTGPAAPRVQVADNYIDDAEDNSAIETPAAPWTCPVCGGVEPLGERFHFEHDEPAPDPADVRNVAIIGHPSSGVTTLVEVAADVPREPHRDRDGITGRLIDPDEPMPQIAPRPLSDRARRLARAIGAAGMEVDEAVDALRAAKDLLAQVKAREEVLIEELLAEIGVAPSFQTFVAKPDRKPGAAAAISQARRYSARIAATGITSMQLRHWAREHGIDCPQLSRIPGRVLDAYEAAHPQEEGIA